ATPTALMMGTGVGARHGILIRDPQSLEVAQSIQKVVFDKTGTLTIGKPELQNLEAYNLTKNKVLQIAASLQSASEHPLAKPMLERAKNEKIELLTPKQYRAISGRGVEGVLDSEKYILGSSHFMNEKGIDLSSIKLEIDKAFEQGHSVSFLASENNKSLLGFF